MGKEWTLLLALLLAFSAGLPGVPRSADSDGPAPKSLTVDAGGPYSFEEGSPSVLTATVGGGMGPVEVRWDFQGDGSWDTEFSKDLQAEYTWPDDFVGTVRVQARAEGTVEAPRNTAEFKWFGAVNSLSTMAQSFVAEGDSITGVKIDISVGSSKPNDDLVVSIRDSLSGPDLAARRLPPDGLPGPQVVNWVTLAFDDALAVTEGETYYLILRAPGSDPGTYETHQSDDTYTGGITFWYFIGVDTWREEPREDLRFAILGSDLEVAEDSASLTVQNVAPTVSIILPPPTPEGSPSRFVATGQDPGNDALSFAWSLEHGPSRTMTYPAGGVPTIATDTLDALYGDDGTYRVSLRITDDDGGMAEVEGEFSVSNLSPWLQVPPPAVVTTDEGTFVTLGATARDEGSDDITIAWWGACAGWTAPVAYWNDPAIVPDPDPSPDVHSRDVTDAQTVVCGDNGSYDWNLKVEDDDGGVTTASGTFSVDNLPPTFTVSPPSQLTVDEGTLVALDATVEDPGSDDLTFAWTWQYGPTEARTYYNDGVGPDPPNSSDGRFPFTASDGSSHTYGDDGTYVVTLVVHDDDGGSLTYTTTVDVANVAPTVDAGADAATDEGSPISFTFAFRDPGFDQPVAGTIEDFTATVDWGDGTLETLAVTEVPGGPGIPTTGAIDATHVFADNGAYAVMVTVCDDDGGCDSDTLVVVVRNVAPTVDAGPDMAVDEATPLTFTFSFSDPGFDFLPAGTVEDFTALVDWGYGAPDSPSVTEVPGGPGVPTTGTIAVSHTYGDNGAFTVTVTVCDDDGGCGTDALVVTVDNVDPAIDDVQIYVLADLRLRVAGEKWHDVRMDLVWNTAVTGTASVTRYPGSPDRQSETIQSGRLQLLGSFAITLYYTPDDDPVNGQRNGANPVWVILTLPDGSDVWLHHTFNVQHPATWTWTLDDLRPYLLGQEITFEVRASDVGSDDLTVAWDFGDGSTTPATTYYNDGVGPDPFPSPEVSPIAVTDVQRHAFVATGTYTLTLTVMDDDGDVVVATFVIAIRT